MRTFLPPQALALSLALCALTDAVAAGCNVVPYIAGANFSQKYSGGCANGAATGDGKYSLVATNGQSGAQTTVTVSGQFTHGMLNGTGRLEYEQGEIFVGMFRDNKKDGPGKFTGTNGAFDEGRWKEGRRWNVFSSLTDKKGARVGTTFVDGKQTIICRSDVEQPSCTPKLRTALLSGKTPAFFAAEAGNGPAQSNAQAGGNSPQQGKKEDGGWDQWLATTGGGNAPSSGAAVTSVRVTGKSDFSVEAIQSSCKTVLNARSYSQLIPWKFDGELAQVTFFPPVDASEFIPGAKGKITPAKLNILFRPGYGRADLTLTDVKIHLSKDSFGEIKCVSARG